MKKIIVLTLMLMFSAAFLQADLLDLGLKFGTSFADVQITATDDSTEASLNENFDPSAGFNFGIYGSINLFKVVSIQMEIYYLHNVSQLSEVAETTFNYKERVSDYIEIPVLLKLRLNMPIMKPFVLIGPSFSILTKAEKLTLDGAWEDIKDQAANVNFSLVFGLGFDFYLFNVRMSLDGRFAMGLSDLETTATVEGMSSRYINLMVALGIGLNIL